MSRPYENKDCPKHQVREAINACVRAFIKKVKPPRIDMLSLPAGEAIHEKMLFMNLIGIGKKPVKDFHFDGVERNPAHPEFYWEAKENETNWLSITNEDIYSRWEADKNKHNVVYFDWCGPVHESAYETRSDKILNVLRHAIDNGMKKVVFATIQQSPRPFTFWNVVQNHKYPVYEEQLGPILLNYLCNQLPADANVQVILNKTYSNKNTLGGNPDKRAQMWTFGFAVNCALPGGKHLSTFNATAAYNAKRKKTFVDFTKKHPIKELLKVGCVRLNSTSDNVYNFEEFGFFKWEEDKIQELLEYYGIRNPSQAILNAMSVRANDELKISKENIKAMADLFIMVYPEYKENTAENFKRIRAMVSEFYAYGFFYYPDGKIVDGKSYIYYSGCKFEGDKENGMMVSATLTHHLKRFGNKNSTP